MIVMKSQNWLISICSIVIVYQSPEWMFYRCAFPRLPCHHHNPLQHFCNEICIQRGHLRCDGRIFMCFFVLEFLSGSQNANAAQQISSIQSSKPQERWTTTATIINCYLKLQLDERYVLSIDDQNIINYIIT